MFIWTELSAAIGIIHINQWGDISGRKTLPKEQAKSLYMSLRKRGAEVIPTPGKENLPDYKVTIDWILERI